jgi:hypothetical protein
VWFVLRNKQKMVIQERILPAFVMDVKYNKNNKAKPLVTAQIGKA